MVAGRAAFPALAAGLLGLLLAACEPVGAPLSDDAPAPPPPVAPPQRPDTPRPSAESDALRVHYQRVQNDLVAQGLLRTDGGGPDTQFTDTMLARNFVRIAMFNEYIDTGRELRAQVNVSRLRRWDDPVRMEVEFGDTIAPAQRGEDRAAIRDYVARLSRVTGLDMSLTSANPNFHVFVLNEDDRAGFAPRLRQLLPGITDSTLRAVIDLPRDTFCLVLANSAPGRPGYGRAVALIRGEHPDLMRMACIHEEIAQGLGLANDSPRARPSIFNDDEEFGLLTYHDELLLKILYDDRLETGMTAAEAAPVVREIARDVMGGPA
ncbi:MAG: DUF2927 domain-containing protein [Alphaproteobacteria bacterium]|jgi:hypothetical protein|nr:DUF2927 domain-containing protein [Alphaproteobacteria bacterium]